jgi:hypothetical protein
MIVAADASPRLRGSRSGCRPIDLPRRNSPIDIDRNLSACLHPARASRVRTIIRICTDTKINAVVKP